MSVVTKKNKYAYLAYRNGPKVVHKYLGLLSDPEVARKIRKLGRGRNIPDPFCFLFWDVDPGKIDLKKNARYVIERVLEMGGLDAIHWIQRIYPTRLIVEVLEMSRKITPKSRNFWTIWFRGDDVF